MRAGSSLPIPSPQRTVQPDLQIPCHMSQLQLRSHLRAQSLAGIRATSRAKQRTMQTSLPLQRPRPARTQQPRHPSSGVCPLPGLPPSVRQKLQPLHKPRILTRKLGYQSTGPPSRPKSTTLSALRLPSRGILPHRATSAPHQLTIQTVCSSHTNAPGEDHELALQCSWLVVGKVYGQTTKTYTMFACSGVMAVFSITTHELIPVNCPALQAWNGGTLACNDG